jgi:WD40 repeat protein
VVNVDEIFRIDKYFLLTFNYIFFITKIGQKLSEGMEGDVVGERAAFSPGGQYLAASGSDGRLRIWDTGTSTLKEEFVPSSHLTATCTALEWSPSGPGPSLVSPISLI